MSLPLHIAFRYLISKKSHNAINIISAISGVGVCVGAMALVVILSVFNGFGSLVQGQFSNFDPDLKIQKIEGKTFFAEDVKLSELRKIVGVERVCEVVQENALFQYEDRQETGVVKGVTEDFGKMTDVEKTLLGGEFLLRHGDIDYAVGGVGLAANMGFRHFFNTPIRIYAPQREGQINMANPEGSFMMDYVYCSGIFGVEQAEYDEKMLIVDLQLARELFEYEEDEMTALEIQLFSEKAEKEVREKIQTLIGEGFQIKNRTEQHESYFRIMQVEKWITYLILSFILLIAIFNIIGSLSMLIMDKEDDIKTLRNLGARKSLIQRIFFLEGWLISFVGAIIGVVIGVVLCVIQMYFGLITMPGADMYTMIPYPIELHFIDVLLVLLTITVMGAFCAWIPTRKIEC
ncbi:MAG: ABC transporter permease [Paludibacteraceae bacterium]|nr:ABC transporter permease [Paludibacteraceae bacterium]